jgi:hypothetical protein
MQFQGMLRPLQETTENEALISDWGEQDPICAIFLLDPRSGMRLRLISLSRVLASPYLVCGDWSQI